MSVFVEVAGERFDLRVGTALTFGRDQNVCAVVLGADPFDRGISRLAGAITHENGLWWIVNTSSTRSLHVVDVDTGIAVPLPVTRDNWPPPRHPVDRARLSVLVIGEILTHCISLTASAEDLPPREALPEVVDPISTRTLLPSLTVNQRTALAAMVEGYLLRFPRYEPEPRTYEAAARRIGLAATAVRKRIENVRGALVAAGVPALEGGDARRNLAEWMLSNRLITPDDIRLLEPPSVEGTDEPKP